MPTRTPIPGILELTLTRRPTMPIALPPHFVRMFLALCAAVLMGAAQVHAEVSMESASLAQGRYSTMHALLEKTILRVDVLTLDLRVGPKTAGQLAALIQGHGYTDALADRAAQLLAGCDEAFARIVFRRDVSLSQFFAGVREDLEHGVRSGMLTEAQAAQVSAQLPTWFAPLRDRGIRDGDRMLYRIHGDAVRTQFHAREDKVLFDRVDVGAAGRLGLLGGYFGKGAGLREGLLRSLFEP
jgi:hypothetical protein